MYINTGDSSSRTTLVNQPGAVKHKNVTEETELYIFRIPKGLFNLKDLVNKEINIGKKSSKVKINGNKYDFIRQPLEGQKNSLRPWLPNSKAVLKPANVAVTAEVRVRVHLSKPSVIKSLDGLEQLAPVVHTPPDLPSRDFLRARRGDLNGSGDPAASIKSSKKKSKRKSVAALSGGGSDDVLGTSSKGEAAATHKKRSLSLEELTPQMIQKPFKKKQKLDKLVASFQGVYDDIFSCQ